MKFLNHKIQICLIELGSTFPRWWVIHAFKLPLLSQWLHEDFVAYVRRRGPTGKEATMSWKEAIMKQTSVNFSVLCCGVHRLHDIVHGWSKVDRDNISHAGLQQAAVLRSRSDLLDSCLYNLWALHPACLKEVQGDPEKSNNVSLYYTLKPYRGCSYKILTNLAPVYRTQKPESVATIQEAYSCSEHCMAWNTML